MWGISFLRLFLKKLNQTICKYFFAYDLSSSAHKIALENLRNSRNGHSMVNTKYLNNFETRLTN